MEKPGRPTIRVTPTHGWEAGEYSGGNCCGTGAAWWRGSAGRARTYGKYTPRMHAVSKHAQATNAVPQNDS